jgi:hypothetical protein
MSAGSNTTVMFHRVVSVGDRLRRLGWLSVWLLTRHGLLVWLTAPLLPYEEAPMHEEITDGVPNGHT